MIASRRYIAGLNNSQRFRYKTLNNSLFGKICESPRKRRYSLKMVNDYNILPHNLRWSKWRNASDHMFGIAKAKLYKEPNYTLLYHLLGQDEHSWVMDEWGYHDGRVRNIYIIHISVKDRDHSTRLGLYFDGIAGTLSYYDPTTTIPPALECLEDLFPIVSTTSENHPITMMLGIQRRECVSLQEICSGVITSCLKHKGQIDQLEIPKILKQFLYEQFDGTIDGQAHAHDEMLKCFSTLEF